jgi:bacterioferritin-associated ferredoxin
MKRNDMGKTCNCCNGENQSNGSLDTGEYVCYCSKVTEANIKSSILKNGATTVDQVIRITGAMTNSNCAVNNPKGTCCYPDIVAVFEKYYVNKSNCEPRK